MNRANLVHHAKTSIDRGSKSFALASKLFDKTTREQVWMLYAWCRECDDLADGQDHGHGMSGERGSDKTIAAMRMLTRRATGGEKTGKAAFDALGIVSHECRIPAGLADAVIDGFALDAEEWRPQTESDLFQYCYHVAGTVGCLMAIVMGIAASDDKTLDRACDLGLAFQLANIARDIAEDDAAGRCYLPSEWLAEMHIDPDEIMSEKNRDGLILLIERLCRNAEVYERSARLGVSNLSFRSRWAVLAAAGIYGDIARAVASSGGDSLNNRVVTGKISKLFWVTKAFFQAFSKPVITPRTGLWNRPNWS